MHASVPTFSGWGDAGPQVGISKVSMPLKKGTVGFWAPGMQRLTICRFWPTWVPFLLQRQPGDLRGLPLLWEFSQG